MEENKLISLFNDAALQIQRLNYIWQKCNNYAVSGNFISWNWQLDRAFVELSNDIWDEDKKMYSKEKGAWYQKIMDVDERIREERNKKELYKLLMEKEQYLRRVQDLSGKGSKKREKEEDLM
jgi:hypothetical protein